MPNDIDLASLKQSVADEVRSAFQSSTAPQYSFGPEKAVETLFALLAYRPGIPNLEGVGESILCGLETYENTRNVTILLVKMEAFAMLLLRLIDPKKHDDLWAAAAQRTGPKEPSLAAVLKKDGLALATNATIGEPPDDLRGKPSPCSELACMPKAKLRREKRG